VGQDPDSMLRASGASAFEEILRAAPSLGEFVLEKTLREEDLTTSSGRANAHDKVVRLLAKVPNAAEAASLAREAIRKLGGDETQLWIEAKNLQGVMIRKTPSPKPSSGTSAGGAETWPAPGFSERDLILLLLHSDDARTGLLPNVEEKHIAHPGLRAILGALRQAPGGMAPEALMGELGGEAERGLLAALLMKEWDATDVQIQVNSFRKRYDIRQQMERIRELNLAITQAQATGDPAVAGLQIELRKLQDQGEAIWNITSGR